MGIHPAPVVITAIFGWSRLRWPGMLAAIPYVILFAGPFLLAVLGRRVVKGPWLAFFVGLPTRPLRVRLARRAYPVR